MPDDDVAASIAAQRISFMKIAQEQAENKANDDEPFVPVSITMCQVEKFKALFEKYYDADKDGFISESDFDALNQKIFRYTGWDIEDTRSVKLVEYHKDLFKCLLAEINQGFHTDEYKKVKISLNDWMKMWDHNMKGALAIFHLPQWVQVMPLNMFSLIDKYGRGHVTRQELLEFYRDFMRLDIDIAKIVADNAWSQMTGNGDFKLNLDVYTMAFSNFLFAKNSYGPGLYVLGTFQECVQLKGFKFIKTVATDE